MAIDYNVKGRNAIFYLLVDGNYYPIFCASVNTFDYEQEEIDTTNINSGSDSEFVPGMGSGTISVQGMTRLVNDDGRVNIAYLLQQAIRRKIHTLQLRMIDNVTPTPNALVITFNAFIRSTNINNDKSIDSTSAITFRITGGLTFDTVIPDPVDPICEVQDPLYIDAVEGATSISDILLANPNITILEVDRSGVQYDQTSGSPVGRRFKYQQSDGTLFFDVAIPFLAGEVIYVLYKQTL